MLAFIAENTPVRYLIQSIWRDEAFSLLVSQQPISFFFGNLTFEPPVYYTLLHFWMKLFGTGEISARLLSVFGVVLAAVIIIIWAEKIFNKHWLSWFLPITFFFNPMILYYAFEIRTYGWLIFFSTATMYAYHQKKPILYTIAATLGFYTHTFMIFVPFVTTLHYLLFNYKQLIRKPKNILHDSFIKASLLHGLLIAPWLLYVLKAASRLQKAWYFPVDFQLIKSVVGNMYIGYEGTPGKLWNYTAILSFILIAFFLMILRHKKNREQHMYFFMMVFIPLLITISVSFIKPMFVNRYLLPVTIAEIFLLAFSIQTIKNRSLQYLMGISVIIFISFINIWLPSKHPKTDIRSAIKQINSIKSNGDLIYAESPLVLFESIYYAHEKKDVFLYNPEDITFPWYVGDAMFSPSLNARTLPIYPSRAFIVKENGTYTVAYQMPVTFFPSSKNSYNEVIN
ncbi:hypothetical protein ACFL1P_00800 [Patescibacteria group bacterium]